MRKLSVIGSVVLATALMTGCGSKATVANNRVYDDNSLKIGKAATATNQYKIIVGKDRVRYTIGDDKQSRKRLKGLTRKEAEEKVLQEAVIEHNCAIIVEPNYAYDMKGKKVLSITVVGYPGYYDFDKDDMK